MNFFGQYLDPSGDFSAKIGLLLNNPTLSTFCGNFDWPKYALYIANYTANYKKILFFVGLDNMVGS